MIVIEGNGLIASTFKMWTTKIHASLQYLPVDLGNMTQANRKADDK